MSRYVLEGPILSYRKYLKEFYKDNADRRKLTVFIIKITVVALSVAFLLTAVMLAADMISDKELGRGKNTDAPDDNTPPLIRLRDGEVIYMYEGENLLLRNAVHVTDDSGSYKLDIVKNNVDPDKAGSYSVTYRATDDAGNTAELTVPVIVTKASYPYSTLMSLVATKAAQLGITDGMSKREIVLAVYEYVNSPSKSASNANIVFTDESNVPDIDRDDWESDWIEEATRALQSGEGDCYSYYSVSKAFFEYFEIDNKGIRRDDSQSNMSGTHFWSMVNIGTADKPLWYFYDGTRLAGKFPDGSKNGCLRTYAEIQAYEPNNGGEGFYAFDNSDYPTTATEKIAR